MLKIIAMKQLFSLLFLLCLTTSLHAQRAERFEYLTMVQSAFHLRLTIGTDSFALINIRETKKQLSSGDFRPLLEKVEAFEAEGWELIFSNAFSSGDSSMPQNYVMMRRRKQGVDSTGPD
jgi:hypothetical protein